MSTVPDKKTSKSRTKRRYAKWAYEKKQKLLNRTKLVPCPQCKETKLTHTICATCGAYGAVKEVLKKETAKKVTSKRASTAAEKPSGTKKKAVPAKQAMKKPTKKTKKKEK